MDSMNGMNYKKFTLMMIISFIIMYGVMFINMDSVNHYHTSATRIYMAMLMVAPMAIVMMIMMGKMYPNKKRNTAFIIGAITLFYYRWPH